MKQNRLFAMVIVLMMVTGCATTKNPNNQPKQEQAKVERITPEELEKLVPPAVASVSLEEIIADSQQGKSTDEIIEKIRVSESRYDLSASQVLDLNKQGVDVAVLDYIQQSNELAKQNALAEEINRREKGKFDAQKQLRRERALSRNRFYDPFWGPRLGLFYGPRLWRGSRFGSRFGWGLRYGYPYGW